MKAVQPPKGAATDDTTPAALAFREWRAQLVKDGWFERNWLWDAVYVGQVLFLCGLGTFISYDYPWLAILLIGVVGIWFYPLELINPSYPGYATSWMDWS